MLSNQAMQALALSFVDGISADDGIYNPDTELHYFRVEDEFGWTNIVAIDAMTAKCKLVHVH